MAKFSESFRLNLSDSLTCNIKHLAYFFKCFWISVIKAKS